MVQLKDIINTTVDKLGQFAKKVTGVSQRSEQRGEMPFLHVVIVVPSDDLVPRRSRLSSDKSAVKCWFSTWKVLEGN